MNKGIFYIPVYNQEKKLSDITDEILTTVKYADKNNISNIVYFRFIVF